MAKKKARKGEGYCGVSHFQGLARFFIKKKCTKLLSAIPPLILKIVGLKETNANQAIEFSVTVSSNSSGLVKNLLLKAEYPFGIIFTDSSDPSIGPDDGVWNVGDLLPRGRKKR